MSRSVVSPQQMYISKAHYDPRAGTIVVRLTKQPFLPNGLDFKFSFVGLENCESVDYLNLEGLIKNCRYRPRGGLRVPNSKTVILYYGRYADPDKLSDSMTKFVGRIIDRCVALDEEYYRTAGLIVPRGQRAPGEEVRDWDHQLTSVS